MLLGKRVPTPPVGSPVLSRENLARETHETINTTLIRGGVHFYLVELGAAQMVVRFGVGLSVAQDFARELTRALENGQDIAVMKEWNKNRRELFSMLVRPLQRQGICFD